MRLTHNAVTKRRTNHKVRTHTNHHARDRKDKDAPPPDLELARIPQQETEEEEKRELDKVDGGVEEDNTTVLILDVHVESMNEIRRWSLDPGPDINLRLIVGQGGENEDGPRHQENIGGDEEIVIDEQSTEVADFDVHTRNGENEGDPQHHAGHDLSLHASVRPASWLGRGSHTSKPAISIFWPMSTVILPV